MRRLLAADRVPMPARRPRQDSPVVGRPQFAFAMMSGTPWPGMHAFFRRRMMASRHLLARTTMARYAGVCSGRGWPLTSVIRGHLIPTHSSGVNLHVRLLQQTARVLVFSRPCPPNVFATLCSPGMLAESWRSHQCQRPGQCCSSTGPVSTVFRLNGEQPVHWRGAQMFFGTSRGELVIPR